MNPETGHLVTPECLNSLSSHEDYEEVPEKLNLSAQLELAGRDETFVGKEATSQVAKWARSKRDRLKIKVKKRKANKLCCQ